jgi:hypothetical protein
VLSLFIVLLRHWPLLLAKLSTLVGQAPRNPLAFLQHPTNVILGKLSSLLNQGFFQSFIGSTHQLCVAEPNKLVRKTFPRNTLDRHARET